MTFINKNIKSKDLIFEKIYRKFYRQLSKSHNTNIAGIENLLKKENITFEYIKPNFIKRFIEIRGYEIKIENEILFFPSEQTEDILLNKGKGQKKLKDKNSDMEWFIPPFISLGDLRLHDSKIESWQKIYNHAYIAGTYIEKYKILKNLSKYSNLILDAIFAYYSGLTSASIAILIPTIEGITREISKDLKINKDNLSSDIFVEVIRKTKSNYKSTILFRNYTWIPVRFFNNSIWDESDEVFQMLEGFSNYIQKHLYARTDKFAGQNELNRHGILHGLFRNYNSQTNFYKLISFIDMLCFIIIYNGEMGSLLAPDLDEQSARLAMIFYDLEQRAEVERMQFESFYK